MQYDFAFTAGVLLHINPDELDGVYGELHLSSYIYIWIYKYYNPAPVTVDYRGNKNRLFKRDFAGEFMDKFPDVQLVEYGFAYHRDKRYMVDDVNWFLLEKRWNDCIVGKGAALWIVSSDLWKNRAKEKGSDEPWKLQIF